VSHPAEVVSIVRDRAVPDLLEREPGRGRVLEARPAVSWRSRAEVRTSGPMELNPLPATYDAPALVRREWYDVVALPRQVVLSGDLLLPESFTTADGHRQRNPTVDKVDARLARRPRVPADLPRLEGRYLHLENVMPRHFGHALTETVSRFWAWEPGLRALVFDETGELPGWQRDLFEAAGIDDVRVATGPVRVETLVGCTPMFSRPSYVHPDLRATYDAVGAALQDRATLADLPARVFFTRRPGKRSCRNAAEVEAVFTAAGYVVVHPEDHPLADQMAMVRAAESIGGFAGSGMFHLGFAGRPVHVVLVASEAYPCHNEYLMSALLGHRLDIVLCRPDVPRVDGAFTRESFHSDYTYDAARDGAFLAAALEGPGVGSPA
jgi:capsular polysaccharide biosynthesis protein